MSRILMVAYSCDPDSSSEAAIGWQLASRIAHRHHVTLLTRPKAQAQIETRLRGDPSLSLEVEYHEMAGLRHLKYAGLPVSNLRYLAWNHRLAHRVHSLENDFDIVHHTSWIRAWMPTAASGAASTPFIWGPVGAVERPTAALMKTMGLRGAANEVLRGLAPYAMRLDPLMHQSLERVDYAVASSAETAHHMRRHGVPTSLLPPVGFGDEDFLGVIPQRKTGDFVSVGRLLHWKGFHLGLRAFSQLDVGSEKYVIIGEGPAESRLRRLAGQLGVSDRVEFTGRLPRKEVLAKIAEASVLVHPSFHDSGGFVIVEAMALGVPAVTLDIGGPPFLAGEGGLAVSPSPVKTLVDRLAEAMMTAREKRDTLGQAAVKRAHEHLHWERIVDGYDQIYSSVLKS